MKHFSIKELEFSHTAASAGIENAAPPEAVEKLDALVDAVLDPLRDALGCPVMVTSGYRSAELNALIRGSPRSQHMRGEAADIVVPGWSAEDVWRLVHRLTDSGKIQGFDQLIQEYDRWVHVSYAEQGNRYDTWRACDRK